MVLVDTYVPALDKAYDFNLDEKVPVRVIIEEMTEMIGQKEHAVITGDVSSMMLCDAGRELALSREQTLAQSGIHNGSSLILI